MAKKKLLEDFKSNPARFYRAPGDVVRDRRFANAERLEILQAWRAMADDDMAQKIDDVIGDVEKSALTDHAAE